MANRRDVTFARLLKTVVALLAAATAGCTLIVGGCAIDGRVVDSETGAPIPGALVIVEWTGDIGGPVQSSQVCFHLEVVSTDQEGRYHVPAWHRRPVADWEGGFFGVRNTEVTRRTFRKGYTQLRYDPRDTTTILMQPFTGSVKERLDYLARLGTVGCGAADGSLIREAAIWEAVCEEARSYAEARTAVTAIGGRTYLDVVNDHFSDIAKELAANGHKDSNAQAPCR